MTNRSYISSSVLIAELIQDYNIQSHDFVTRFSNWCVQCLGDLNIRQAYVEKEVSLALVDGKVKLPDFYHAIIAVYINNRKVTSKNPNTEVVISPKTDNVIKIDVQSPFTSALNELSKLSTVQTPVSETKKTETSNKSVEYYINQGWLHATGITDGNVVIRYLAIPIVYDGNLNMEFPLIYNDEILKEAIKLFVLKRMLNRGYVHPVQNLNSNNVYTNPGLRYDQIRYRVRTSVNKFSVIDREEITKVLNEYAMNV